MKVLDTLREDIKAAEANIETFTATEDYSEAEYEKGFIDGIQHCLRQFKIDLYKEVKNND